MSEVPDESRPLLLSYKRVASRAQARFTSDKNIRTHESRLNHYLTKFLPSVKLQGNPLLLNFRHETQNDIIVAFALYLLTGNTLLARSIKVNTAKAYIKAVSDFFHKNHQFNPAVDKTGAIPLDLDRVYKEAQRWESMPNRSEALTPEMVEYLYDQGRASHQDSAIAAVADWAVLSLQAGFRISEYAQAHSAQHMSLYSPWAKNIDGSSRAFIHSDFRFTGHNKRTLSTNKRHFAKFVHIKWRFQKNGNNGEVIPFARNNVKVKFCPVRAAHRIIKRAERLQQTNHSPIALSLSPNKKMKGCSYLTSTFMGQQIKLAAKHAHGISAVADLKKFTPHSPRVGACVLLHITGQLPDLIKKRLRWKSDTYEDYLRHIDQVATDHVNAICSYLDKTDD